MKVRILPGWLIALIAGCCIFCTAAGKKERFDNYAKRLFLLERYNHKLMSMSRRPSIGYTTGEFSSVGHLLDYYRDTLLLEYHSDGKQRGKHEVTQHLFFLNERQLSVVHARHGAIVLRVAKSDNMVHLLNMVMVLAFESEIELARFNRKFVTALKARSTSHFIGQSGSVYVGEFKNKRSSDIRQLSLFCDYKRKMMVHMVDLFAIGSAQDSLITGMMQRHPTTCITIHPWNWSEDDIVYG